MSISKNERTQIGRIGANISWSKTSDRSARTAPARAAARAALFDRFEREIDPTGTMPELERLQRAEALRKAHFQRMALNSARSRRRRAEARRLAIADADDTLAAEGAA